MDKTSQQVEPFFFQGGKVGCLLVHGFSGSPSEMRQVGEELHKSGYTVSGVLLAGHGKAPSDMKKTDWKDWYNSVERSYQELEAICEQIFLIGLSMGGLLCIHGAVNLKSSKLKGIIPICAPIFLADKKSALAPIAQYFKGYYRKKVNKKDEALNADNQRFTYYEIPLNCLASLLKLIKTVKGELGQVKIPALVLQSRNDKVVVPKSGEYIYRTLGTSKKKLEWLEKSGHLATIDIQQEKLLRLIKRFIVKNI